MLLIVERFNHIYNCVNKFRTVLFRCVEERFVAIKEQVDTSKIFVQKRFHKRSSTMRIPTILGDNIRNMPRDLSKRVGNNGLDSTHGAAEFGSPRSSTQSAQGSCKFVSPSHRPHLPTHKRYPCPHFCYTQNVPKSVWRPEGFR